MLASAFATAVFYWKTTVALAIGTPAIAVAWPYWEPFVPALRYWVRDAGADTRKGLDELILQGVEQRRDSLSRDHYDATDKLKKTPNFENKQRLDKINESLGEVEAKRKLLLKSLEHK